MKDQYFGDENDYRKYGLLRCFGSSGLRILIAWMLTPNDGGNDGRLRGYLTDAEHWRTFDPDLHDGLSFLLGQGLEPAVSLIENSGLLPSGEYFSDFVPNDRRSRKLWFSSLLQIAEKYELVFLDPDNGLEVPSRPYGRKGSSKYVFWDEVVELWRTGSSLLLYQHYPRVLHEDFSARVLRELQNRTAAPHIEGFRTKRVLFLLAGQERHVPALRVSSRKVREHWAGEIECVSISEP